MTDASPTGQDEPRHATWLELFFDLVFVLAVGELTQGLIEHADLTGFLVLVALFVPVWWAWVGIAFYATRFAGENARVRVLLFCGMLTSAALALRARPAFDGDTAGFALGYAGIRFVLVALYLTAAPAADAARAAVARAYACAFASGATVWLLSAVVPAPARYVLWAAGLAIDLGAPLVFGRGVLRDVPTDTSHLPERFGAFVLIVLGEAVVLVASGLSDARWVAASVISAVSGFAVVCCVWWTYFDVGMTPLRHALERQQGSARLSRDVYSYGHFPLVVGVTALAAGLELTIHAGSGPTPSAARWLVPLGLSLFLLGQTFLQARLHRWIAAPTVARLGLLALVAVLAAIGLPAAAFAAAAACLYATLIAWGVGRRRGARQDPSHPS